MPFFQHDHLIPAVTSDGADQPFHVSPLPWTCWRGEDFLDAQALDSLPKVIRFLGIKRETVRSEIAIPSLSNSP